MPVATAILDRLLEDAQIIHITGKSYRIDGRAAKRTAESWQPAKRARRPCLVNRRVFLGHGRTNRMIIRNENGPGSRTDRPGGRSSRLTRLSLVGLHPCRAQFRFTRQLHRNPPLPIRYRPNPIPGAETLRNTAPLNILHRPAIAVT